MQKPYVIIFLIILPLLIGLACLQTTYPAATLTAATPTAIAQDLRATVPAVAAANLIAASPTATPACAVISANKALHLRRDPGPEAQVLAFMRSGEVVKLLSTNIPDWWLIKRGNLIGYARSRYLKFSQCE